MNWGEVGSREISTLFSDMKSGKLALPEFQRDFVWEFLDIERLLESILAGFPAGSLMLWQTDKPQLSVRPLEGAPPTKPGNQLTLVLDGQQRLTSLWTALASSDRYCFYVDVNQLAEVIAAADKTKADWRDEVDQVVVQRKVGRGTKAIPTAPASKAEQISQGLLPVFQMLDTGEMMGWLMEWTESSPVDPEIRSKVFKIVSEFSSYRFPVIELSPETSLEAVCRIFETVNRYGVVLSPWDLLTARFFVKDLNLRHCWENETPEEVQNRLDDSKYSLLQVLALVKTSDQLFDSTPVRPKATRSVVLGLDAPFVAGAWAKAANGYNEAIVMLEAQCGWSGSRTLPYPPLVVTMAAWQAVTKGWAPADRGRATAIARQHYFASVFSRNYDEGSTSQMGKDLFDMARVFADSSAKTEAMDKFAGVDLARDVAQEKWRAKALLASVLSMVSAAQAEDFFKVKPLFAHWRLTPKVDVHHIFPKAYLATIDPKLDADVIANATFLTPVTNQSIGKRRPSDYLAEMKENLINVPELMRSHLVSAEALNALHQDDYPAFIEARSATIRDVAQLLVDGDTIAQALGKVLPIRN
ncbi:unannotated protein [freshwater metagenome]|uniref:Unannotated protein n=1 Tax=freshwater metagenome TaxID=449393 RepID=A0A6J7HST6_9ZZZZ|nr:DUF262 domain-containing protein [Actinomycetota bacterium]